TTGVAPGHLSERSAEDALTSRAHAQAIVDIPKCSSKPLVNPACLFEHLSSGHHARTGNRAHLLDDVQMLSDARREPQPAEDHSFVCNGPVQIAEPDSNRADLCPLTQFEHGLEPIERDHTRRCI